MQVPRTESWPPRNWWNVQVPKGQGSAMDCHNSKVALQRASPPSCMVWNWDPYFTDLDLGTVHMVQAPCVQKSWLWARDNQHSTTMLHGFLHRRRKCGDVGGWSGTWGRTHLLKRGSAMFKISLANLHMVIKRRLQDKNMTSLSSGGASTLTTQTVDLAAKYPREKKKNPIKYEKNAECFFICKTVWVRTKSTLFRMLSLTFIQRKARETLWRKWVVTAPQGRFFCAGRGDGTPLDSISTFAHRFSSLFSCNIELLWSQFFFPVCSSSCFSSFSEGTCVFN